MRVLFISAAILAYATAAPSGVLVPIAPVALPSVGITSALPTINPGDIQAAVIDAKVAIEDQARELVEQAKLQAELNIEEQTARINEANDLAKEKANEAVWSAEEQKWQALETVQTAAAQIDGSVASSSPALARSAISGIVVPSPVFGPFGTPIIGSIGSQIVYTPGIVAPLTKSFTETEIKSEPLKIESEKIEAEKTDTPVANAAEVTSETTIEAVSTEKATEEAPTTEKPAAAATPQTPAIVSPIAIPTGFKFADPWPLTPITYYQPGLQSYASINHIHSPLSPYPTIITTQW